MRFSEKYGQFRANILMELDDAKRRLEDKGRKVINLSIGTPVFTLYTYPKTLCLSTFQFHRQTENIGLPVFFYAHRY